jgi:hypothetical protein
MAAFNKINSFVEDLAEKVHNLASDTLKLLLTNAAPLASNTIKANLTEIAAGFGYSAGGPTVTITSSGQVSGTYKLVGTDVVITASGGAIGPARYVTLYNDTPTSPADPLIGWWDYGSSITLADGETLTVDFDGTNGILQLA